MENIISKILDKKELQNIDKKIVKKIIQEFITPKIKELIQKNRYKNKEFKDFVSQIRAILRRQYGMFQNIKYDREELITKKDYIGLLKSHVSSSERLNYYKKLYNDIFKITGVPKSIIDIGCGMNPISFEMMGLKNLEYYALDISPKDLDIINTYFNQKKIKGFTRVFDAIRDDYNFNKKFDQCFVFKLFEILETTKSHKLTEKIFNQLPSKWVIASFSTKTLSDKFMTRSRRVWFEVMLKRLNKEFKIVSIPNELFYVIKKEL